MEFNVRDYGPHKIFAVSGEVDLYNVADFKNKLFEIINTNVMSVVVDMKNISYMDSSGIGALVAGQKKMKMKNGQFYLLNIQNDVLNVLRLATLDKFFKIYDNESQLPSTITTSSSVKRPGLAGFRRRSFSR